MSLADRLDSARRLQESAPSAGADGAATRQSQPSTARTGDPMVAVKERVHQSLIEDLGPRLYDPHLKESELAVQVRQTLQTVIDAEQTPLSLADRTRIAQEVSDEILGHGPLEPLLRDADVTE
ncbi:MAG TPA: CpaF family protein, partial [Phycicoccus sp.]|nr:CpaF family protein [Phycicoccus sp.]